MPITRMHITVYCLAHLILCALSVNTDHLIGYWPFDGDATDMSGYSNNGIIYNAILTEDRFNQSNSAYYFEHGLNSSIEINYTANNLEINTSDLTLSVWIQTAANGSSFPLQRIFSKGSCRCVEGYQIRTYNDNSNIHWEFTTSLPPNSTQRCWYGVDGSIIINDGEWHHIVTTLSNVNQSTADGDIINSIDAAIYVDGVLDVSTNNDSMFYNTSYNIVSGDFRIPMIGVNDVVPPCNNEYFEGKIDDIRIYSRVLSMSEILQLYHQVPTIAPSNNPIKIPSNIPTKIPSLSPNLSPTIIPTGEPSDGFETTDTDDDDDYSTTIATTIATTTFSPTETPIAVTICSLIPTELNSDQSVSDNQGNNMNQLLLTLVIVLSVVVVCLAFCLIGVICYHLGYRNKYKQINHANSEIQKTDKTGSNDHESDNIANHDTNFDKQIELPEVQKNIISLLTEENASNVDELYDSNSNLNVNTGVTADNVKLEGEKEKEKEGEGETTNIALIDSQDEDDTSDDALPYEVKTTKTQG